MSTLDGRFAPSPTGELHVGNLRTALLAWLHARSENARFLIRIEDLDVGRVRERFVAEQLDDLRAIGLDWDGEPARQSQRDHLYRRALDLLRSQGRVYRCFCSRREIREAASAQHGDRPEGAYPGTCAVLSQRESDRRAESGDPFALRLRAEGATVAVRDTRHGTISRVVDDLVLVRRDGAFAYNLAVVVDDAEQSIGEVVRGDDLLPSTPDQAFLCDLLELPRPQWTHVPLILGPDGARLAKRHGAVTLRDLGARNTGPDEVRQFLSVSLGLTQPGEAPGPARLLARFGRETVPRDPLILSREIRDFLV